MSLYNFADIKENIINFIEKKTNNVEEMKNLYSTVKESFEERLSESEQLKYILQSSTLPTLYFNTDGDVIKDIKIPDQRKILQTFKNYINTIFVDLEYICYGKISYDQYKETEDEDIFIAKNWEDKILQIVCSDLDASNIQKYDIFSGFKNPKQYNIYIVFDKIDKITNLNELKIFIDNLQKNDETLLKSLIKIGIKSITNYAVEKIDIFLETDIYKLLMYVLPLFSDNLHSFKELIEQVEKMKAMKQIDLTYRFTEFAKTGFFTKLRQGEFNVAFWTDINSNFKSNIVYSDYKKTEIGIYFLIKNKFFNENNPFENPNDDIIYVFKNDYQYHEYSLNYICALFKDEKDMIFLLSEYSIFRRKNIVDGKFKMHTDILKKQIISCLKYKYEQLTENVFVYTDVLYAECHNIPLNIYKLDKDVDKVIIDSETISSTNMNTALINYILINEPLNQETKDTVLAMLESFGRRSGSYKSYTPFYAYHGTSTRLGEGGFTTLSLFSVTSNINVARKYASANRLNYENKNVVPKKFIYILKIKNPCPYIVYPNDKLSNCEILLPLKVSFKMLKEIEITDNFVLVFCEYQTHIEVSELIKEFTNQQPSGDINSTTMNITNTIGSSSLQKISTYGSHEIYKDKGSSNGGVSFIYKEVYIQSLSLVNNLKCILNELIASHMYSNLFGVKSQSYDPILFTKTDVSFISYFRSNKSTSSYSMLFKSEYNEGIKNFETFGNNKAVFTYGTRSMNYNDSNLTQCAFLEYKHFLINCIAANWDAFKNFNTVIINDDLFYVDVGGALAYRAQGNPKIDWVNPTKDPPTEHLSYNFLLIPNNASTSGCILNDDQIEDIKYFNKTKVDSIFNNFKSYKTTLNPNPINKLLNLVKDQDVLSELKKFIENVLDIVGNRIEYYHTHCDQILDSKFGKIQAGGIKNTKKSKKLLEIEQICTTYTCSSMKALKTLINAKKRKYVRRKVIAPKKSVKEIAKYLKNDVRKQNVKCYMPSLNC